LEIMNKNGLLRARIFEVAASVGLGIEAAALLVAAIAYGVYAIFGGSQDRGFVAGVGVFCLALATGVGFAAYGTWGGRRWARSVALTWQVFQAGIGLSVLSSEPVIATILIVLALGVAALVMVRAGRDDAAPTD